VDVTFLSYIFILNLPTNLSLRYWDKELFVLPTVCGVWIGSVFNDFVDPDTGSGSRGPKINEERYFRSTFISFL
jgi:hypothetical protein